MTVHLRHQVSQATEVPGLAYYSAKQARVPATAPGLPEGRVTGAQQALDQLFGYYDLPE